jgi:hypothetical protein
MRVVKKLGVTRQHLHRALAEKAPMKPECPASRSFENLRRDPEFAEDARMPS